MPCYISHVEWLKRELRYVVNVYQIIFGITVGLFLACDENVDISEIE